MYGSAYQLWCDDQAILPKSDENAKNSLSFGRETGKTNEFVRGGVSQIPFRPGMNRLLRESG